MAETSTAPPTITAYEAPTLDVIGGVWEHTLHGCWWGKELGGSDGRALFESALKGLVGA